jgi:hypothetical protein
VRRTLRDRHAVLALAAFVALLFADVLFAGRGFFARDLTFYHWPLKKIVRDTLLRGELPLWSRPIAGGQPLAANPAYEVFYPPQWLIFLPSYRLGFQLHIVLHLMLAACGAYLLLRQLRAGPAASIAGALSFALGGPLLSTATMLPFLFAWTWAPFVALFALRFEEEGRRRDFALAAAALALQVVIGEPTTLLQIAAILGLFALGVGPLATRPWRRPLQLAALAAAACTLAAVQLLPAIDFARDSVRAVPFEWSFASAWTLPWQRLVEVIVPAYWGPVQADAAFYPVSVLYGGLPPLLASLYPGLLVAVLGIGGLAARGWRSWKPALLIVAGTLVATGPLFRLLWLAIPSIRYPEKFILGPLFILTFAGALTLDRLVARRPLFGALAILFMIADLAPRTFPLMPRMPRDYFERPTLVTPLAGKPYRVVHETDDRRLGKVPIEERYRILRDEATPDLPALDGVEMAVSRDYDQTHLLVTRSFEVAAAAAARAKSPNWPSVFYAMSNVGARVLPGRVVPLPRVQPRYLFASAVEHAESEEALVRLLAGPRPIDPRSAFVGAPALRTSPGEVRRVVERANGAELDVVAAGPAVLLASVTHDRHWHALVDGREVPIVRANLAFQAIFVPPGAHHVRFQFRAPLLGIGAAITLLAIAALVGWCVKQRSGSQPA